MRSSLKDTKEDIIGYKSKTRCHHGLPVHVVYRRLGNMVTRTELLKTCHDRNVICRLYLLNISSIILFRYIHMYTNYLNKNITCTMCLFKSALTRNKGKFGEDLSNVCVVYFILQDLGRRCSRHFL